MTNSLTPLCRLPARGSVLIGGASAGAATGAGRDASASAVYLPSLPAHRSRQGDPIPPGIADSPVIGKPEDFPATARSALARCTVGRRRVAAWSELFSQGDESGKFFIVSSGWVCQYRLLANGHRLNLKFALAGDMIGFAADDIRQMDHSAVSLTEAELWVIDMAQARRLFRSDVVVAAHMVAYLMREEAMARERLTSVARTAALERVAHLLYELFHRVRGRSPEAGDEMLLPLTQELIGDAVGLSAVHVNRMMGQLRREQTLRLNGGRLQVLRPHRFAELAGFEPSSVFAAAG